MTERVAACTKILDQQARRIAACERLTKDDCGVDHDPPADYWRALILFCRADGYWRLADFSHAVEDARGAAKSHRMMFGQRRIDDESTACAQFSGAPRAAIAFYTDALARDEHPDCVLLKRAEALREAGELERAYADYMRVFDMDEAPSVFSPNLVPAWMLLFVFVFLVRGLVLICWPKRR